MKPEKAIEVLKRYKKSIESDFTKPEEMEPIQTYNAAVEALKKQVPMKVIGVSETWEGLVGNCPSCKKFIIEDGSINGCCQCLQKLDWCLDETNTDTKIRWTGDNLSEVINFIGLHSSAFKWRWDEYEHVVNNEGLKIFTPEGSKIVKIGDYVTFNENGDVNTLAFNDSKNVEGK